MVAAALRFQSIHLNQMASSALSARSNHYTFRKGCCPVIGRGATALRIYIIRLEITVMNTSTKIAAALLAVMMLASCGNTIRGLGRDTSNTVDATQDAAKDVTE